MTCSSRLLRWSGEFRAGIGRSVPPGAGPLFVMVALGGTGIVLYPFGLIGVRTELAYLLEYLRALFTP